MAKFKAFTWGSWFTLAVCAAVAAAGIIVATLTDGMQGLVVGILTTIAGGYIAWNYYDAKRAQQSEWVYYNGEWDFNVFCCDEMARVRWNFEVGYEFAKAMADVATSMKAADYMKGLTFRLVSGPFSYPRLPGLNNGVFDVNNGVIMLSWPAGTLAPAALRHELAHVPIALRDNIDGEAAHGKMKELGLPW